jgi:hypothetical protein
MEMRSAGDSRGANISMSVLPIGENDLLLSAETALAHAGIQLPARRRCAHEVERRHVSFNVQRDPACARMAVKVAHNIGGIAD